MLAEREPPKRKKKTQPAPTPASTERSLVPVNDTAPGRMLFLGVPTETTSGSQRNSTRTTGKKRKSTSTSTSTSTRTSPAAKKKKKCTTSTSSESISPGIPDEGLQHNDSGGQTSKLPIRKKKEATAVVQAQGVGSPAMNTRSKVPTSPDSPAMGTRSKRKLNI